MRGRPCSCFVALTELPTFPSDHHLKPEHMHRHLLLLTASLLVTAHVNAQTAFGEVASMSDKEFKKTAINTPPPKGDKRGQSGPYWPAYEGQVPQRVALVSFYVFDKPFSETTTDTHQELSLIHI